MSINRLNNIAIDFNKNVSLKSKTQNSCQRTQTIGVTKPITKDQVTFKGLEPEALNKIFNKSKIFWTKEYDKLSKVQIELIRKSLPPNIIKNRDIVINLTNTVKKNLDKLYPEGYVFGAVGRSPEIIARALELHGIEAKYCPVSNISIYPEKFKNEIINSPDTKTNFLEYKNYFDSIGLTKDNIVNNPKKICFVDYTQEGYSLSNFEQILKSKSIDLNSSNIDYKSLNMDLILKNSNHIEWTVWSKIIKHAFEKSELKVFSRYKSVPFGEIKNKDMIIQFSDTIESKLMDFALIDYHKNKTKF